MIVRLSSDAELDVTEGYRFYEEQADGLGNYFRDCIVADIESLSFHGGIHQMSYGYHRLLAKRFPFAIYYERDGEMITVVAVLDARRAPSWTHDRLK